MGLDATVVNAELRVISEKFLATSPEAKAHALALAKAGEKYAKGIAPVGEKDHRLKSGYVDHAGDYRDSIEGDVVFKGGRWRGRVTARDFKAHWIEYGTKRWPKLAIMRRTRDYIDSISL
jgi:hypothetical protein